jgi:Tfp pilus assembly protein PilE
MSGTDIRDIVGLVPIHDPWLVPLLVVAGLAVGVLCLVALRAWRRRRGRAETPEVRALARLAEARRIMEPSCAREFGVAVSTAIRLYIEERFAERAAHRTTEEFLRGLATVETSPLAARRPLLEGFLQHCDLAKFARFALTAGEMEALHASALRFVRESQEAGPSAR